MLVILGDFNAQIGIEAFLKECGWKIHTYVLK
jgi:hypothetical protein